MSIEKTKNKKKIIFLIALLALVVAVGTYAWFTFSQITGTDIATATTGEDDVNLYISSEGGSNFKEGREADIVQVSSGDKEDMMPVSTANLNTFLYATGGVGSKIVGFDEDTNGKYFYKGRVYLKATTTSKREGSKLDIYLDGSQEGPIVEADEGSSNVLNGSRAGITFNGGSPTIFWLSDKHNENPGFETETIIDGKAIGEGKVLTKSSGKVVAVDDPSVSTEKYSIDTTAEVPEIPEKALFSMEFNKIYAVDLYFYLEGCDVDCTATLAFEGASMHFAFYGVLN